MTLSQDYQLAVQSPAQYFSYEQDGQMCLRLYARVSNQRIGENTSTVDILVTKYLFGAGQYECPSTWTGLTGELDDTIWDRTVHTFVAPNEYTMFERSYTLTHDIYGRKSLSLGAECHDAASPLLSTGIVRLDLPAFDRLSQISEMEGDALEQGLRFYCSTLPSLTHRLIIEAGGRRVLTRENYVSGATVTPSAEELLSLYRAYTNSIQVRLETYHGTTCLGHKTLEVTLPEVGNLYLRMDGQWRRVIPYVGSRAGVAMIKIGGTWRVAR